MVAPAWGTFQKPDQKRMELSQDREIKEEIPGKIEDEKKPEGQKPQWGNFQSPITYQGESDPTEDESGLEYFARNAAQLTSRIGEQVAGRIGNLEKFTKDTLSNFPQTGGIVGWALSKLIGPEKWEKLIRGSDQQTFPTSQKLREVSEKVSGGYTKPKTKSEERRSEYAEDVGSLLQGRRQPNLIGRSAQQQATNLAVNKLLIPAAANVTKNIVEDLGFGKDNANLAKMAVWLPLSLASNINAGRYASNLMNEGRNGFNNNQTANIPLYQNDLNRVSRNMLHGDPRSALAQQQLNGITNDINNGQTSMRDLMTRYDAINAAKRDRGLFALNPGDRRAAIRNINQVRDVVRDQIRNIGASNPQALQQWENGVQAWATIHRSNALTNWVENLAKGPYSKILSGPAAALFGIGSYGASKVPLVTGSASVSLPLAYKTGQTIYRMWNDPRLAGYYWNSINAAMEENTPTFINNYLKLNKELEKSESTQPKSKSKKD